MGLWGREQPGAGEGVRPLAQNTGSQCLGSTHVPRAYTTKVYKNVNVPYSQITSFIL